jgi:hypothetical protein
LCLSVAAAVISLEIAIARLEMGVLKNLCKCGRW